MTFDDPLAILALVVSLIAVSFQVVAWYRFWKEGKELRREAQSLPSDPPTGGLGPPRGYTWNPSTPTIVSAEPPQTTAMTPSVAQEPRTASSPLVVSLDPDAPLRGPYNVPSFGKPELTLYDPAEYEQPLRCAGCKRSLGAGEHFYSTPLPDQGQDALLATCILCYGKALA